MRPSSIRRQLMTWVLVASCVGAPVLSLAAYWLTLGEIDEVLNDSLKQTALLLADRDLRGFIALGQGSDPSAFADTESKLVAIARRTDGTLLFTSTPQMLPRFDATPGRSIQRANGADWHVYTVVQPDRFVQVAQPTAVRRESAAESASQLLVPLVALIALVAGLLMLALRRGMRPLAVASEALARRGANSLEPLTLTSVPAELLPVVQTLNDLLGRLDAAFAAQRNFVADAAHELRSPVTALQLQVQVLERSRDPDERALATSELAAGIGRARRLIEQLLQLSRASADDNASGSRLLAPVRLDELVRNSVVRWASDAERRGIDLGAQADVCTVVHGDAAQLGIMLGNLVENALRYTPRGGVVDVIAAEVDGASVLRVIDDGPGIGPDEQARVFDRFYRSAQAETSDEPGSGLGLAIVRSIADGHGAIVSLHRGRRAGEHRPGLEVKVTFRAPD